MTVISDTRSYTLRISGMLDADFLTSYCPAETSMIIYDDHITLSELHTDQAGILGIIRQLHNFGCVLLFLAVEEKTNGEF